MFRVSFTAEVQFKVTVMVRIRVKVKARSTIGSVSGSRYSSGSGLAEKLGEIYIHIPAHFRSHKNIADTS